MNKDVLDYTIEELESLPLDLLNKLSKDIQIIYLEVNLFHSKSSFQTAILNFLYTQTFFLPLLAATS